MRRFRNCIIIVLFVCGCFNKKAAAQDSMNTAQKPIPEKDMSDVFRYIFKKKPDTGAGKADGFAVLPSFGYNPSFGFVIGAKAATGIQYGDHRNTSYSTIGLEALYTSKGIITAQAIHNIFTAGNQLNWQGNWQLSRFGIVDYGLGSGAGKNRSGGFVLNDFPVDRADSTFPIKYTYIRLNQKLYKKIAENLYAGGGVSLNFYTGINDEKQTGYFNTPHQQYSERNNFNPSKYNANGLIAALQYNTLEHPARAYGGLYAEVNFRFNQTWIGSTKNAVQFQYDIRKFWSLGSVNPAHVIAIWHWASYKLSGSIPYLELPSTGSDTYKRSGRGYTIGRFKGASFAYFETEYRFPITKNKLISGVCFFNLQSASTDMGQKIFSALDRGGGAGLRILFKKQSRNTLCIDFSKGQYGSSGIFFGLNEVF